MKTIFKLVIVGILAYLAWTKGLPLIQSYGFTVPGAPGELNTEGWGCVRKVEDVRDLLVEAYAKSRPNEPVPFYGNLREEQDSGETLCDCRNPGCAEGKEALYLTAALVTELNDPGRVGEAVLQSPRHLEKLDAILERAKAAARSAPTR